MFTIVHGFTCNCNEKCICDDRCECVDLIFQNDTILISVSPEDLFAFNEMKDNEYNSDPGNGDFKFRWDDKEITFTCAKYGNGKGGSINITIRMTPEILKSLQNCIDHIIATTFWQKNYGLT